MGLESVYPPGPLDVTWGLQGSTHYVVSRGRRFDKALPPIIWCHGQPNNDTWQTTLTGQSVGLAHSTYRVGHRSAYPFTGRNWGHESNTSPSGNGGTGLTAIDDVLTALGNPATVVLCGISMGGLNVLRWAWLNPSKVHSVSVFAPAWDMLHLWDTSTDFRTSMNTVFGTSDRTGFEAATVDYDPRRNAAEIAAIGAPVTAFMALDDNVVGTTGLTTWATDAGIDLTTTPTGGHFAWVLGASYDELNLLRAIAAGA